MPKSRQRVESLQTAFSVRLYGLPLEGIGVERQLLNRSISQRAIYKAWAPHTFAGAKAGSASPPPPDPKAPLANIYGYARGNTRTILPRPLIFLVDDEGKPASGWDQFSEAGGFSCWDVDPQETTYRFDVQLGVFRELLIAGESPDETPTATGEPDGGVMIRGADNRLYLIPLPIDDFVVEDPREISELQIQAQQYGREIEVDSVRTLSGRSTLVARSTLQVRSTMNLRSTLAGARR